MVDQIRTDFTIPSCEEIWFTYCPIFRFRDVAVVPYRCTKRATKRSSILKRKYAAVGTSPRDIVTASVVTIRQSQNGTSGVVTAEYRGKARAVTIMFNDD